MSTILLPSSGSRTRRLDLPEELLSCPSNWHKDTMTPNDPHMYDMNLSEQGKALKDAKRYEEAIQKFRESFDEDFCYLDLHQIGQCYIELGQHKEAIVPLAASVGLGASCRAPLDLAIAFHALGNLGGVLDALVISLERNPTYGPARRMLKQDDMKKHIEEEYEDFEPGSYERGHPLVRLHVLGLLDKL